MLLKYPKSNVVIIYDVIDKDDICWIDMECLECLDDAPKPLNVHMEDLKLGLEQLHTLGVVYIDIKVDNIGYSTLDKVYKIFDFNCSGIVDIHSPKLWNRTPCPDSYNYNILKNKEENLNSLYDLDALALEYKLHILKSLNLNSLHDLDALALDYSLYDLDALALKY